ncbi:hypothetical protein [Pseudarthrobacter sp. NamE5]|uniref:hypothetical protein n=1 Tax=Pseudarthrobacter sp. NamE5 TaxID=2576839 RepID=UPI00110B8ADE|nr:hypothetical protein [Pseudarthrobacter sp. NamE5]TLM83519.1 hypothetical protein FDW84_13930 [Pseudarthrobacter sp. NamE5]
MTINSPDSLPEDERPGDERPGDERPGGAEGAMRKDDGGIPAGGDGIGIAADAEPNTFEPEEDPDATEDPRS